MNMVIDSSALIAYLNDDPEADRLEAAFITANLISLSAASLVEAVIVAGVQRGEAGEQRLDQLLERLRVQVIPVTIEQAEIAHDAYRRFGKVVYPKGLNFGDCFSYALAHTLGEPLLYVGKAFTRTDVEEVWH